MPWFGGGGKKTVALPSSNLQIQKTKQVEGLKKGHLNLSEIIKDVEYRVSFQSTGNNFTLIIALPPQFPAEKPTVTVEPVVRHPWVDQQSVVTKCPNLINFTVHSSLLTAIWVIIEEFKIHPPALASHISYTPPVEGLSASRGMPSFPCAPPAYLGYGPSNGAMPTVPEMGDQSEFSSNSSQSQNFSPSATSIPDVRQIDIFKAFPDIKNKSHYELMELVEEEDKVLELIQKMPQLQHIAEEREKISCRCSDLAKDNLEQKPKIEELTISISKLTEEFETLQKEFEQNQIQQLSLMDQLHPAILQSNMKVAVMEAEEESEKCVEDFLNKEMDIDAFTRSFIEKRTLYHARKAKEEKLNQMAINEGY